jgi:CheY-like chemotaxis protein
MQEGGTSRILLRAEFHHAGHVIVAHTLELTSRSLSFACSEVFAPNTIVPVTLSFPRLVEPFDVEVRVVSTRADEGPGRPASVLCEIRSASARSREVLAALVAMSATPPVEFVSGPQHGYRCLLVEDNSFIRDLFSYGLDKYGRIRRTEVSLDLANDAEQAWDMLRAGRYDLAIIDHFLPVESGSELITRMRAEPDLRGLPVVAISVGGPEVRAASIAAGADLFLDKPIVLRDLFSTLDRLGSLHELACLQEPR